LNVHPVEVFERFAPVLADDANQMERRENNCENNGNNTFDIVSNMKASSEKPQQSASSFRLRNFPSTFDLILQAFPATNKNISA
jgi:hypothetical protein